MDKANDNYLRGIIIENTFTSICDMADAVFSFLKLIPRLKKAMLRLNWDSLEQVQHITKPVFFISGDQDTLVPTEMTYRLSDKTKNSESKEVWIVPGGQHNNTFMIAGPMYCIRLRQFLDKCKEKKLTPGLGKEIKLEKRRSPPKSPVRKPKLVQPADHEDVIMEGLGSIEKGPETKEVIDELA